VADLEGLKFLVEIAEFKDVHQLLAIEADAKTNLILVVLLAKRLVLVE
jgi:hypothetical protein